MAIALLGLGIVMPFKYTLAAYVLFLSQHL
jgi:hypothetical protein